MKKNKERRTNPRVPMVVKVEDLQTGKKAQYYSREVSSGGLFLETNDVYSVGTPLQLSFEIPGSGHHVDVKSSVVHSQKVIEKGKNPGMGIRFEDIDSRSKKLLIEYVEKLEKIRKKLSDV